MQTVSVLTASLLIACAPQYGCRPFKKAHSCGNSCINNLRQIEAGKEQWALEQGKATGDRVDTAEVNSYIKGGQPTCPANGIYTYNVVGSNVACSITNHYLP